jgi:hypothetical protein
VTEEDGSSRPYREKEAPYRLMFAPGNPGENTVSVETVEQMVTAVRNYNADFYPDEMSQEAVKTAERTLAKYERAMGTFLRQAQGEVIYLITPQERAQLEQQGATFSDHMLPREQERN